MRRRTIEVEGEGAVWASAAAVSSGEVFVALGFGFVKKSVELLLEKVYNIVPLTLFILPWEIILNVSISTYDMFTPGFYYFRLINRV